MHSWRWQAAGEVIADQRPFVERNNPVNKRSETEYRVILSVCNSPRFNSAPPSQIGPILSNEGRYLDSESAIYCVLRKAKLTRFTTTIPNQVRMCYISSQPSQVKCEYYKLYMIENLFSRYLTGWRVHAEETRVDKSAIKKRYAT
ncbi:hypothetical protein [Iodobacter fluviatilis]|uniref:Uncharacterized protein n=1 Tax=Iodobacter fluviatilis TaxID=537 RepID=A0A7G3GCM8_9NEIS|nr:hypothetical protein [Iodobacter fluviatilis]QBC44673.1 hypothetical protein C1H71_14810 [Iodobacter fluviatilis]